jgi:CRISPR-associated Csx3 family protein
MQITWKPEHLPQVFMVCEKKRKDLGMGKSDVVVIDGVCPTWLLPAISHAFHPTGTAVNYPQGGPDAILPVSGAPMEGDGSGKDLKFKVLESEGFTTVEFELAAPQIDAKATIESLVVPQVPLGKSVRISGRGPIAIAAVLAETYAHKVPAVACFQPGVGFVTCISHDEKQPIGSVSK